MRILKINVINSEGNKIGLSLDLDRMKNVTFGLDENLNVVLHAPALREGSLPVVESWMDIALLLNKFKSIDIYETPLTCTNIVDFMSLLDREIVKEIPNTAIGTEIYKHSETRTAEDWLGKYDGCTISEILDREYVLMTKEVKSVKFRNF